MGYYAHSGRAPDKSDWQTLKEHLFAVAGRAADRAGIFGLERAAAVTGLFHDLGKYNPPFQRRLEGAAEPVDHSTAGAQVVCDLAKPGDAAMAQLIAYCILGHHAGLPDRLDGPGTFDHRMKRPQAVDAAWKDELKAEISALVPDMVRRFPADRAGHAFAWAFMGRMLFSALVDADFSDTERFYEALGEKTADRDWPALSTVIDDFIARFDAHMATFSGLDGELNRLRRDVLAHVRAGAEREPGLFTLTVPTGGGKTLASLGFALDHARRHGHRRIIYAIPFTSIIDQTAAIFRAVLGDDHVLEHHSSIEEEKFDARRRERKDKLKLAMEDWAAPVVVTTTVQLFESLFTARPSRARKLHNIAGSIIILDEAQTLPKTLLTPIMRALEELARNYGCTIVLCTATQPALGKRPELPGGLPLAGQELAPDPLGLAAKLARTHVVHAGEMNNAALLDALAGHDQALVIVNSRRHALDLYREAGEAGLEGLVHLTTRQYAAHRRRILADVRDRLKDGRPCRLIATSLIEAGVDVDFPVAWRAEAGLDQIVQAAGRVNREGRRERESSIVTVFKPPDYRPPAEIGGLIGDMGRIIGKHADLTSLAAIEDYFGEVYWRMGEGMDGKKILDRFTLSNRTGCHFDYRTVGQDFRMIESGLAPVIVALDEDAKEVVDQLTVEKVPSGLLARKLQSSVVQVPPKARDLLIRNGHVAFVAPQWRGDQFAVLQTASLYHSDVGLLWEDADYLGAESYVL
ncbi:CRISPR-associated helicase Cas3' [Shinella daejeonensis]|uniref:CRISPR-associated helicase Cas3' n=1 Tax=Shinella daejeonensis TaxID=659017 RepID=UPI0020C7E206|nr:CRISPR-associated helicase Cas3' [Shinella daejeonensis]MCP8894544.1 CRISPR-associated helicase Cas3' [Shinella daejeonensis]